MELLATKKRFKKFCTMHATKQTPMQVSNIKLRAIKKAGKQASKLHQWFKLKKEGSKKAKGWKQARINTSKRKNNLLDQLQSRE